MLVRDAYDTVKGVLQKKAANVRWFAHIFCGDLQLKTALAEKLSAELENS